MLVAVTRPLLGALQAVPPAVRYRIKDVLGLLPTQGEPLDGVAEERLARLLDEGDAWLGADPVLAEIGYWMLEPGNAVELRRRGCRWLTMFPSVETVRRLADVATDPATPRPVREQAIWSLGYRQIRAMHPSTQWTVEAIQLADEALYKLADAATTDGKIGSEQLPQALRHVQADVIAASFARAPGMWGEALECFATPPLARVLFVSLDDIPPQHRLRALRLIAATLGEDAIPLLLARAGSAPIDEQLEILFLAVSVGGERHLGRLEASLKGMKFVDLMRQRARWHLANPGVIPTVRGLRIARTTATIPAAERAGQCARAADDLGVLTKFARYPEAYLYTLWGWMVRGAGDPGRARELVAAHPESQRLVRELYLGDLARRGRVKQLTAAAQTLEAADLGALQLAIWGRPFAALELAATARLHTPELVCARALASYRAGRPDLTERILADDLPPSEITDDNNLAAFPGPHERWLIEHAGDVGDRAEDGAWLAIVALAKGREGVVALAQAATHDAEPDTPSLDALSPLIQRLGRGLPGRTVYLAGEFKQLDRDALAAAVEQAGARLVSGPFPGTDYYVHGDWCLVETIAQLERQGARRLRPGELRGM
ncbi:MAG: hypothetical protein H6Q90_4276 [Deltaproteobacteria bacterium]|nr:hypothetical protein [Deltaproteobacteria bacterium]